MGRLRMRKKTYRWSANQVSNKRTHKRDTSVEIDRRKYSAIYYCVCAVDVYHHNRWSSGTGTKGGIDRLAGIEVYIT